MKRQESWKRTYGLKGINKELQDLKNGKVGRALIDMCLKRKI